MRAKLADTENVLVGIGGEVSVEKKIPDALATLDARRQELTESFKSVQKAMGDLSSKLNELNMQAEQMAAGPR